MCERNRRKRCVYGRLNSYGGDMGNQQSEKEDNNFIKFFLFLSFCRQVAQWESQNTTSSFTAVPGYDKTTYYSYVYLKVDSVYLCAMCKRNLFVCDGFECRQRVRMWERWNERTNGRLYLALCFFYCIAKIFQRLKEFQACRKLLNLRWDVCTRRT